jgi:Oxidoreductase-like protein, N-terminal
MPEPPIRPRPGECCGLGCVPCVYDLYEEALEGYETKLRQWHERQPPATSTQ